MPPELTVFIVMGCGGRRLSPVTLTEPLCAVDVTVRAYIGWPDRPW